MWARSLRAGSPESGRSRRLVIRSILKDSIDRLTRLPIGAVLILALVLRLGAGVVFSAETTDTYEFGRLAQNVVEGNGYSYVPADEDGRLPIERADEATMWLPSAQMPPAYPYVTVIARELTGSSHSSTVRAVRGFNLLMACGAVLAVAALARRLWGTKRAATLAALGFAVYPPAIYMATQVSAANLYVPVQLVVLLLLLVAACRGHWPFWVAAGFTMGALSLMRAETVLLVLLAAVWLWWASRETVGRRRYRLTAGFVAVALVLPGAWLVRNSLAFGEPTYLVATTGGSNLWIGNHPGASGSQKSFEISPEIDAQLDALPPTGDHELRAQAIFREAAIENMTGDPLGTIARDIKKLGLLLGADIHDARSLNPGYLLAWGGVAVLGAVGLVQWWQRAQHNRSSRFLIAGFLLFSVAVPVIFFALARYKLPIEVMLLVFAGGWLASWAHQTPEESETCATVLNR